MDPNIVKNYPNLSYEYQPLFIIQNKHSPLSLPKLYSVAQPITTNGNAENNSLKTFYENSLNVVGNIIPAVVQGTDLMLSPNQSPNVEEYLINPTKTTKITENVIDHNNTKTAIEPTKRKTDIQSNPPVKKKKKLPHLRANSDTSNNHTSVSLLKVGNKYHSIGPLSEEQMKLVKQGIENIGDPEKDALKPTYDAATKTKIIYKVVSPNDLKLVGQNKIIINKGINDAISEEKDKQATKKKVDKEEPIKITRSGRMVKVPKHIIGEGKKPKTAKHKKRIYAQCFYCSNEFNSVYSLQRHYQMHPSHIPNNTHSTLYQCLLSIINSTSEDDKAHVFVQQLEDIISKVRATLPCMFKRLDGPNRKGKWCNINTDVARLFGMKPGIYNLNIDALSCVTKTYGMCEHSKPTNPNDITKPSQVWLSKHIEETANENQQICARTNSVQRVWKSLNKKKINPNIEPEVIQNKETEVIQIADDINPPINIQIPNVSQNLDSIETLDLTKDSSNITNIERPRKEITNFGLNSPPPSEVFTEFQINLSKIAKYDGQVLRPELFTESAIQSKPDNSLDGILEDLASKAIEENSLDMISDLNCKNVGDDRCFERPKNWTMDNIQSQDSYQSNACIQPTMIHIKDTIESTESIMKHSNVNEMDGVLDLSDSLISEPLNDCLNFSELRHTSIDDLFNFNNP